MKLKYALYDTPVPRGKKNKGTKHARIIRNGTIDMEMMCELVSQSSSFSSADVKGIVAAFTHWMGIYLAGGSTLKMEGLGHFYTTIRSREGVDSEGKRKVKVRVDSIGFRCAPVLKKRLYSATLEEVKRPRTNPQNEKTRARILHHIRSNGYINISEAMYINDYTRYAALSDLKMLMENDKIRRIGKARQTIYISR